MVKELNYFIYLAPMCQVMVENGGTINFSGKFHIIKLSIGKYVLNSPMISIPMGGVDVVLGVQWLQSLSTITFDFQEIFLKLFWEGKEVELKGIAKKPRKVINSNGMTKLLKREQWSEIAQLCSQEVQTMKSSISTDLQKVLENHYKIQEVEYHIEHQQQDLEPLKGNLTLAQNQMKKQVDQ